MMDSDVGSLYDVVIVGGGISGLTLAYYLEQANQKEPLKIALLEASDILGGKLKTVRENGFVMDQGPDSVATRRPEVAELISQLGIESEVISPAERKFTILKDGELQQVPLSLLAAFPKNAIALLESPLISWTAKIRAGLGAFASYLTRDRLFQSAEDQSLASYFRKKYGKQVYDQLFSVLFAGLYGGDLETISYKTFKSAAIRGATRKLPPYVSFKTGIAGLIDALATRLVRTEIFNSAAVQSVTKQGQQWKVYSEVGEFSTKKLVLALPADRVSNLMAQNCPELSRLTGNFTAKDAAIMTLAYNGLDLKNTKAASAGSGVIVPENQSESVRGITISSEKWKNRAEAGNVLLRIFAKEGVFEKLGAEQQKEVALKEVKRILGISQEPDFCRLHLWPKGSVHFAIGHFDRLDSITEKVECLGGLKLLGSSFGGIGIGDCIYSAKICSEQIFEDLGSLKENCSAGFQPAICQLKAGAT